MAGGKEKKIPITRHPARFFWGGGLPFFPHTKKSGLAASTSSEYSAQASRSRQNRGRMPAELLEGDPSGPMIDHLRCRKRLATL